MDLGWDGICIEPHPEAFDKLKKTRNTKLYNCCVSNEEKEIDFLVVNGYAEMLSGIFSDYDPLHIKRIDDELDSFCMKISDKGQEFLFHLAEI